MIRLGPILVATTLLACTEQTATHGDVDVGDVSGRDTLVDDTTGTIPATGLPRIHTADLAAAARGADFLGEGWPGAGVIPKLAMRHLYLSWTSDLGQIYGYYSNETNYWVAFEARYGMRAGQSGELPLGFVEKSGGMVSVTCLLCHADRSPGGDVVIGLPNSRLDLQGFYDDLRELPDAFEALKQRDLPEPYKSLILSMPVPAVPPPITVMATRTGAAGATDAMGLGLAFGALAMDRHDTTDRLGYQTPAPWWTAAVKELRYADGSTDFGGNRAMLTTVMGLGASMAELAALIPTGDDIEQYLVTLEAPAWPFEAPDAALVATGRALFGQNCASCHGTYEGDSAGFPDRVVPLETIGTDPVRVTAFGPAEEELINALMQDTAHPMRRTGGYLAPPLTGIWASAPYFHNGSVPDLAGVLDSSARPDRWRRTGDGDAGFDRVRVGWRFEVPSGSAPAAAPPASIEARRIYETSQPGLSNAGHTMGDALDADQRQALIAYLKTL